MKTYEEHFETSCKLRDEFWKSVGAVDPDVLTHLINPAFRGGPMWPSVRQAYVTVRTPERTIIASDGLSDPYDDMETNPDNASYNGFGLEVYVVADKITGSVQTTWEFQLAYEAAQIVADAGNMVTMLNDLKWLSTEFYNVDAPPEFINEEGRVGAILGLEDATIGTSVQLSIEPVKMVNVKLLTLAELDYIIANGEEGRNKVAALLMQQGNATLSSVTRASVI